MDKTTAHVILGGFDIAALGACYYVISECHAVESQLATGADSIVIQKPLGLYLLLVIIPFVHTASLFRWSTQIKKWINFALLAVSLIILCAGIAFDSRLETRILSLGYHHCPNQSQIMTSSEFKTYLKKDLQCQG